MTGSSQGAGGPDPREQHEESRPTGPVIRDKRRVDPETGQVRKPPAEQQRAADQVPADQTAAADQIPADQAAAADQGGPDEHGDVATYPNESELHPDTSLAADRLEDLRRLQAEYVNYKRRVDRDRARDHEVAVGGVVEAMLPVLDDIHSAREHGDLVDGPFAAIADKLEATLGRFGVERFGQAGETFDPNLHHALMHLPGADLPEGATGTTVVQVVQPGFRVGERIVRAARVAVADPA